MAVAQAVPGTAAVDEILITSQLLQRARHDPDHAVENKALNELALLMVEQPAGMYQRLVGLAVDLCNAGSAGISLLETTPTGDIIFRWKALAGAFAPHVGGHTPRDFSPCGICLDRGETILLSWPARRFDYFNAVGPLIAEGLIIPLYAYGGKALGTIWIVSHDAKQRFDAEDARVMEALARFLALALEKDKLVQQKELLLREMQHRSKNNLQMISSLLSLQRRKTGPAGQQALDDALARVSLIARVQNDMLSEGTTVGGNLSTVVRDMCARVAAAFGAENVEFDLEIEDVATQPSKVLPISLIINELVTNAIKHAFPDSSRGRICVQVRRSSLEELMLRITDDGAPFRGSVDELKDESLGLQLIEGLAAQLNGRVVYPGAGQKSFTVLIPA
jgi:two-component sensor histidine kinase